MNRQTILARINHHLRDSFAETGVVRPLGEIVSRVAVDLRSDRRDCSTRFGGSSQSAGPVIPIEQVAAFVDGGLSSAEADQICEAVMVDNGVLAELVAAVRGSQQPAESLTPLPESLAAQLVAMQSQLPCPGDRQTEVPTESGRWVGSEAVILPPPVATAVIVERPAEKGRVHRREQPASRRWKIAGWIAVAASILAIVALATRQRGAAPNANEIAEHQRVDLDVDRQPSLVPQVDRTAEEPELGPRIVDVDSAPDEATEIDMVKSPEAGSPARQPPSVDSVAGSEASRSPRPVRTEEVPALDDHMPPTPSVTPPPSLPSLRWKEITGLLAAQDLTGSLSSQQRIGGWKSIAAETSPSTDRHSSRFAPYRFRVPKRIWTEAAES